MKCLFDCAPSRGTCPPNRLAPTIFFLFFQAEHWAISLCFSSPPPHYDIFKPQINDYFQSQNPKSLTASHFPVIHSFITIQISYQSTTGQVRSISYNSYLFRSKHRCCVSSLFSWLEQSVTVKALSVFG